MVFAYVSDENYLALSGVSVECVRLKDGNALEFISSASGTLRGNIEPGRYRLTLAKEGYGSKWAEFDFPVPVPLQLRLMSDSPSGFMWPKWVRSGELSEIRVSAAEQYQLSLWRYGLKKEPVGVLSWFDEHAPRSTTQLLPDNDFSQTGVNWNHTGYPAVHPQQKVSAPDRSGLYYVWGRTLSRKLFSFPWVVAPTSPAAPIAVLANTNTWNVYNSFGGRSNYINPTGLPKTPTVHARLELGRYTSAQSVWMAADEDFLPLSFERPEPGNDIFDNTPWDTRGPQDPIDGRMQCGQAPGEWRLLAWLEREGFSYDYYADGHLHDGTLDLDAYSVLLVGVHPEYWTRAMFARVAAWVRGGGRLMYLGGNGMNCEVEFTKDALRCLSHEDLDDNLFTGNESRMHRTYQPESSLVGVAFTNTGAMTAAPYRVRRSGHWLFNGTGLQDGDLFGRESLHDRVPGGASGHETDKIMPHSPRMIETLAQGTNPDDGGAHMVLFDLGAGQVFSTGSITWVAALFPSRQVSRITHNVLTRFLASHRQKATQRSVSREV